ncbi:MAG: hypothetical protein OJF49_002235 [Ktedonobacterales bacterium]|nr:MAG: hypothetical protein OJF49_002235 [Ktedonobacterales bacterium]
MTPSSPLLLSRPLRICSLISASSELEAYPYAIPMTGVFRLSARSAYIVLWCFFS